MKQETFSLNIKTLMGLEEILAKELSNLGLNEVQIGRRLVSAKGGLEDIYRINLCSRTALRVLVPIETFQIQDEEDLYQKALAIDWNKYLQLNQTFAIDSTINSPLIKHTKFAAYRLKDAVVDWFKEKYNSRPDVDVEQAQIRFSLHISGNNVTISLDSSGESLHKRGYRTNGGYAPVNEVLAAGMLALAGYNGSQAFVDLMTGSGTLAIEAALIASHTPPLHLRGTFGFHHWPNYNEELWKQVYTDAMNKKQEPEKPIIANDIDAHLIDMAIDNAFTAGIKSYINFEIGDFELVQPKLSEPGIVVVNPPYGERIQANEIEDLYKRLGNHFKHEFQGSTAWILSSNFDALKRVGLKSSQRLTLFNGSLPCRFVNFELYGGTKKRK